MKRHIALLFFLLGILSIAYANDKGSYTIPSADGLDITVQAYLTDDESAPFILLCHQAGWSRGEYQEIAPRLNEMGYNCLAIDQRSGGEVNGVKNETFQRASKLGKSTKFVDAVPDIEAAMMHILDEYKQEQVILWGSSYSSSIVLYLAARYPEKIHSALCFAPGNYFRLNDKKFSDYAAEIKVPIFMTSAKSEERQCQEIFEAIPGDDKTYYLPNEEGYHGSRALWTKHEGNDLYWQALIDFLSKHP